MASVLLCTTHGSDRICERPDLIAYSVQADLGVLKTHVHFPLHLINLLMHILHVLRYVNASRSNRRGCSGALAVVGVAVDWV